MTIRRDNLISARRKCIKFNVERVFQPCYDRGSRSSDIYAQYIETETMNPLEVLMRITCEATNRCYLKYNRCLVSSSIKEGLLTEEAKAIIDKSAELKILYLKFAGDKLSLRKKCIKLLFMATNGISINDNDIIKAKETWGIDIYEK